MIPYLLSGSMYPSTLRKDIVRELRSRGRGLRLEYFGVPRLLPRLDSIAGKVANDEVIRNKKLSSELIDS